MKLSSEISPELQKQLADLAAMSDDQIDTSDIPEAGPEAWKEARRPLYKPLKKPVTLRVDLDVIDWYKNHALSGRYQTEMNRILRQHMLDEKAHSHG
ncbi:MAG: BrnA antitoxin family protein [Sphingomonadales bacterium]|nr:BrnA antitoxin family protein [Sphingomonadales bacterium]